MLCGVAAGRPGAPRALSRLGLQPGCSRPAPLSERAVGQLAGELPGAPSDAFVSALATTTATRSRCDRCWWTWRGWSQTRRRGRRRSRGAGAGGRRAGSAVGLEVSRGRQATGRCRGSAWRRVWATHGCAAGGAGPRGGRRDGRSARPRHVRRRAGADLQPPLVTQRGVSGDGCGTAFAAPQGGRGDALGRRRPRAAGPAPAGGGARSGPVGGRDPARGSPRCPLPRRARRGHSLPSACTGRAAGPISASALSWHSDRRKSRRGK